MKNFFLQRWKRIRWAASGLCEFLKSEVHARIHLVAIMIVVAAGLFFGLTSLEWMLIVISIGMVILAEIINTVIEKMMDFVHPDFHPDIKIIKDMGAGAVLWVVLIAVVIGVIIFVPKIF